MADDLISEKMFPPGPGPYSVKELAEHWQRKDRWVKDLCGAPDGLMAFQIGRDLRIPRESVEAFLRQRRVPPADGR